MVFQNQKYQQLSLHIALILCRIICQKGFIIEKEEGVFENIPKEDIKKINDFPQHNKNNLLACNSAIT